MRKNWRLVVGLGLIGSSLLCLWADYYLRYIDWPPQPDPVPFTHILGEDRELVTAAYVYVVDSGFLKSDYLWRIEAKPKVADRLVQGLGLRPAGGPPELFWSKPPCWWKPRRGAGNRSFKSDRFTDGAALEGEHYFLVYDEREEVVYVWHKSVW
jgi:hypothetical protein